MIRVISSRSSTSKLLMALFLVLAFALPFGCGGGGGGGSDTPTPPTVTGTTPLDNSSQVHPDADIVITFSTAMNTATVQAAINLSPATTVTFSPADWNVAMTELTITPDNGLLEDTLYTVTVGTGAQDSDETALESPHSFDFTTGDIPFVTNTDPSPSGTTGVSPDTWIGYIFSEPMNTASVEANLSVDPTISYTTQWLTGDQILYVKPDSGLAETTAYTVTIDAAATDLEGTAMGTADVLSFTTEDRPIITSSTPANGTTSVNTASDFVITFSDPMSDYTVIVPDYVGVINASTEADGTVVRLEFASDLVDNTVYTVQVAATAKNSNGTYLDGSYEFVFSTGPTLTGKTVSGHVTESSSPVSGAEVKLLTRNSEVSDWYYDFAKLAVTDVSGNYTMSLVQNGTYWPAAVKDTNGDGLTHLHLGDAYGIADSITVSASDLPNTDISIHDPEAISGSIYYAGAYASSVYAAADDLQLYAFVGTDVWTGDVYLSNEILSGTQPGQTNQYNNSEDWTWWLNPHLDSAISVTGSPSVAETFTQTFATSIPAGSYQVMAWLDPASSIQAAGFAQVPAEISGAGDDATGVDINLYDLIDIGGHVELIEDMGSNAYYSSGRVSLLNWPLWTTVSNVPDDGRWKFTYENAPVGLTVAVHAEPDPADSGSLYAFNTQYFMLAEEDATNDFNVSLIDKEFAQVFATNAGITMEAGKATVMAFVKASNGSSSQSVAGATVSLSTGDQAYYADSSLNFGYPYTQYFGEDGPPSVFFFNVDPDGAGVSDGVATITTTHPDGSFSFDTVYVPVRADEFTFAELESDTGYNQAPGYVIYGNVRNVQAETGASGASVILHEASGAVLGTTSTDSGGDFAFFGLPYGTRGYVKASDTGFLTVNSELGTVTDDVGLFVPLVPEAMAATVVSLLDGFNESSWNSTLQSYCWYMSDINFSGGGATSGVQLALDAVGASTSYYNSATGLYDASATTSEGSEGPMILGYAPNSSAGIYSIDADNFVVPGTKEIPLVEGELTYIEWINYD